LTPSGVAIKLNETKASTSVSGKLLSKFLKFFDPQRYVSHLVVIVTVKLLWVACSGIA